MHSRKKKFSKNINIWLQWNSVLNSHLRCSLFLFGNVEISKRKWSRSSSNYYYYFLWTTEFIKETNHTNRKRLYLKAVTPNNKNRASRILKKNKTKTLNNGKLNQGLDGLIPPQSWHCCRLHKHFFQAKHNKPLQT